MDEQKEYMSKVASEVSVDVYEFVQARIMECPDLMEVERRRVVSTALLTVGVSILAKLKPDGVSDDDFALGESYIFNVALKAALEKRRGAA